MSTTYVVQTIRDTFHAAAVASGLKHTGGAGAYSEFTGPREAWRVLYVRLDAMPRSASTSAAKARVVWALT